MLFQHRSLTTNILLLAALVGIPYAILWGYLLLTGHIGITEMGWVCLLLAIDALLLWGFVRGLVMPLRMVSGVLRRVAEGDFTVTVENPYRGQIGQMLEDVRRSVNANRDMMEKILDNTVNVASSSFETVNASAKVVFNVEEEERHVSSITDASGQITEAVAGTAANETAQDVNRAVTEGNVVVRETIDGMAKLADAVADTSHKLENLGESSRRIGEITKVINDIAEQTRRGARARFRRRRRRGAQSRRAHQQGDP